MAHKSIYFEPKKFQTKMVQVGQVTETYDTSPITVVLYPVTTMHSLLHLLFSAIVELITACNIAMKYVRAECYIASAP